LDVLCSFAFPPGTASAALDVIWSDGHEQRLEGVTPRQQLTVTRR